MISLNVNRKWPTYFSSSNTLIIHSFRDMGMLNMSVSSSHVGGFFVSLSFCLCVRKIYSPAITCTEQYIVVKMVDVLLRLAYMNFRPIVVTGSSINSNIVFKYPTSSTPWFKNTFILHCDFLMFLIFGCNSSMYDWFYLETVINLLPIIAFSSKLMIGSMSIMPSPITLSLIMALFHNSIVSDLP